MKKLALILFSAIIALPAFSEEDVVAGEELKQIDTKADIEKNREYAVWPAFIALYEWPETPELVGLRLAIPFSTKQDSVTGLDLGFFGRCYNFEGIAVNLLANDVKDTAAGLQVGLGNFVNQMSMFGVQVGLWNEARGLDGVQVGLVNVTGDCNGFQVGLFNRTETMHGYQIGVINVIRDAQLRFMPVLNIGF